MPEQCAREPLGELCQIYWRPIFGFIRRQGYNAPEAQDLTQDFFIVILEGKLLSSADPSRGRFRSLLLKSLKNFLIDARIKTRRQKRGGGVEFVPWDDWSSDSQKWATSRESCPAETLFDLRWAATIAEEALRRLREECESKGNRQLYEALSPYLDADRTEISYRSVAIQLKMPEKPIKRLIHQFRKRFRTLLREEVAKTIENPDDIEDEIRYLCAALSSVAA
jgi:RNA polymerase sigma-70 factor (ECF subfamily)